MSWDQQSPVNLQPTAKLSKPAGYLRLHWRNARNGFAVAGEHGVKVAFPLTLQNYLELDGKRFVLREFHFHHPSEHFVENRQFAGELHLVHQNLDDCSHAVIGIPLKIDPWKKDSRLGSELVKCLANASQGSVPAKPLCWLPKRRRWFYRYEGSLTTEPFAESVSWIVLAKPKAISPDLFGGIFGKHPQEARSIQPLNRRYVLKIQSKILVE
jgi:carbonic anhydrase